jgi:hypothetical protein
MNSRPFENQELFKGNCITIGAESCVAFYQSKDFLTGNKMYRLYSKNLNNNNALFICNILNKIGESYSYSNAWVSEKIKKEKIKLPSKLNPETNKYEPDWQYMEDYIANLEKEIKINYINKSNKIINISDWKKHRLGELFESSTGDFDIQNKHIDNIDVLVVSSGVGNYGIIGKSSINANIFEKNTITVDMFGNVFHRNHQYKMVTHGRVFSLKSKRENTKKQNFYISTIINKILPIKFNYSNMCSWNKIKDITILLPSRLNLETNKYEPDWQYMEDYIANLEKEFRKQP